MLIYKTFVFEPGNFDYYQALSGAENKQIAGVNGYLLFVGSPLEDLQITNWLWRYYPQSLPRNENQASSIWMGISDADVEGSWKVTSGPFSGQAVTYTKWLAGEPNNVGGEIMVCSI